MCLFLFVFLHLLIKGGKSGRERKREIRAMSNRGCSAQCSITKKNNKEFFFCTIVCLCTYLFFNFSLFQFYCLNIGLLIFKCNYFQPCTKKTCLLAASDEARLNSYSQATMPLHASDVSISTTSSKMYMTRNVVSSVLFCSTHKTLGHYKWF